MRPWGGNLELWSRTKYNARTENKDQLYGISDVYPGRSQTKGPDPALI